MEGFNEVLCISTVPVFTPICNSAFAWLLEWSLAPHLIVSYRGGGGGVAMSLLIPNESVHLTHRMCRPEVGCPPKQNKDINCVWGR